MRITNLHLIVSFFLLSGIGFFAYEFVGRNAFLPGLLPSLQPPLAATVPKVDDAVRRRAEEIHRQQEEERARWNEARLRAEKSLKNAEAAIETAREDNRDVTEARGVYDRAKGLFDQAKKTGDLAQVKSLADEAVQQALEAKPGSVNVYVVKAGDNLWTISKKKEVYGRGVGWVKIWRRNEKKVPDFDLLAVGQELIIPRQ